MLPSDRSAGQDLPLRREVLALLVLAYVLVFRITYVASLSPRYAYMGFVNHPIGLDDLFISTALALTPTFWLPRKMESPSFMVQWVIYLMVFIPAMTVPFYAGVQLRAPYTQYAFAVTAGFFLSTCVATFGPNFDFKLKDRLRILEWSLFGFTAMSFLSVFLFGSFKLDLSRLDDVYGLRSEYVAHAADSNHWISYLVSCQADMVSPALLALGLTRRSRKTAFILTGILSQVLVYMITGFKAAPLSVLLLLAFWLAIRKSPSRRFPLYSLLAFISLILLGALEKAAFETSFLMGFFQQRTLGMPGLLSGAYFEFYSSHQLAHLGYGILKGITAYPYGAEPPAVIGYLTTGLPDSWANANLWTDAFANFGLTGVLGISLLFGGVLWAMDQAARGRDPVIASLIMAMPAISIANSSLLTSLLTQGVTLAIVAVAFLPPKGET